MLEVQGVMVINLDRVTMTTSRALIRKSWIFFAQAIPRLGQ